MRLAPIVLLLAACSADGTVSMPDMDAPSLYIASQSDFADYATWETLYIGEANNSGHPVGPEWGYRNKKPVDGAYEVGTILVKEIRTKHRIQSWDLFAMAKRGDNFDSGGATNWEFFTLALDDEGVPVILSRGANPSEGGVTGHGYGGSLNGITCNRCHGVAGTAATDHTLSVAMRP